MPCSAKSAQDRRSTRPPEAPDSRRSYMTTVKARASASGAAMPVHALPVRHFSMVASKPPGASISSAGPVPLVMYSTLSPSMVAVGMGSPSRSRWNRRRRWTYPGRPSR